MGGEDEQTFGGKGHEDLYIRPLLWVGYKNDDSLMHVYVSCKASGPSDRSVYQKRGVSVVTVSSDVCQEQAV